VRYHWHRGDAPNFGDDLNAWLWPRLFGDAFAQVPDEILFVGMGSILRDDVPPAERTVVFGAGIGYGPLPTPTPAWDFAAVRGPLTAAALALDEGVVQGDPAMLVPRLEALPGRAARVSLMPHHLGDLRRWRLVARALGWQFIDATQSVERTLAQLRDTRLLLTAALHGAIVADALRVPWVAIRTSTRIQVDKWRDWAGALELEPRFRDPFDSGAGRTGVVAIARGVLRLRRLASADTAQLSRDRNLRRAQDRLLDAADRLRHRLGQGETRRPAQARR